MKKYIGYIIAAIVVIGALSVAWFAGSPVDETVEAPEKTQTEEVGELYADEDVIQSDRPQDEEQPSQVQEEPPAVTEEEPQPEPANAVSLTVDCSDILSNMDSLPKEKQGLVPDDGIIFSATDIEIIEGESAFDVLKRALTASGVHLEFNLAPVTNSAYIEGIGNIYEFDCGERSGWKFSVNGEFPRVGCSDFKIKPGDKIVFVYKVKAY